MTFDIDGLKENPNDEESWQLYSDELQSKGDPLGELIVLEYCLKYPNSRPGADHNNLIDVRQKLRKIVEEQLKKEGVSHVLDWYHGIPRGVKFKGTSEQKSQLINENLFIQPIETIQGDYKAFSRLVPGTRRHVDELWKDRLVVPEVRDEWFYTADGAIYFLSKDGKSHDPTGKPYFALTRENQNPLLKNLDEACKQLLQNPQQNHPYRVPMEDLESALDDPETEVFDLDKLSLIQYSDNRLFLHLQTNLSQQSLNDDQQRLVERVYGRGDDFPKVMKMLAERKWSDTMVYVLNPDYVREHASVGAIGRASWLSYFNGSLSASDRLVYEHGALCGVVSSERS